VVRALSEALFGQNFALPEFSARPDLKGVGLTDNSQYAEVLAEKFDYRNTFYDKEPFLDITDPPEELLGTLDFLISSEVFEHVPPPVERAFEGGYRLLRPGGVLVLTVPYTVTGETVEHFPTLHDFKVERVNGSPRFVNRTEAGEEEIFEDVSFHGGWGLTVEMRIFSLPDVLDRLREAGFSEIVNWRDEPNGPWGCYPIVGRR
jgi:SAM-dependent methyltransferase